ncbi:MAG: pilus assembly protein [Elusimicrobiota bacterium]|jgi:hypothetical protein|nr:pilus assembly protein [Elusimicrobiota bacterium]
MLKYSKGQALVEAALTMPIIVFFLLTIIWFGRVMLTWQQLVSASRYGTDLIANTPFSKKYIENDIKDYLCNQNTIGRILDPDKLKITIEIKDFPTIDFKMSIDNIDQFFSSFASSFEIINSLFNKEESLSYVEISYTYKYPAILNIVGKESFELKARSQILSGSGSPNSQKRQ